MVVKEGLAKLLKGYHRLGRAAHLFTPVTADRMSNSSTTAGTVSKVKAASAATS